MPSYNFSSASPQEVSADLLLLILSSDAPLNTLLDASVQELLSQEGFEAKAKQSALLRAPKGFKASRVLLLGVGEAEHAADLVREVVGAGAKRAMGLRAQDVAIGWGSELDEVLDLTAVVEGAEAGAYAFKKYVSAPQDKPHHRIDSITLLARESDTAVRALRQGRAISNGVRVARDLVNEPPQALYPQTMAERAQDIAKRHDLQARILDDAQLRNQGFNLIIAVGKGCPDHPPRLIHLTYESPDANEDTPIVAFVGKGITFDTGGNNIKTGNFMLNMHSDMGGGAAVLGAAEAIGMLKPKGVVVHFIVPSAENSADGLAMRPNDIYKGYGGKTVEIHNTDAEGRLVLADGLAYAQKLGAETIIDLATLTGACVVALGEYTSALFTNDEGFYQELQQAIEVSKEDFWRMPLSKKLDAQLDTPVADMKNLGKRYGGAITAALFLKRWVDIDRWAHLDIAGPAWGDAPSDNMVAGGTGFGVSTLVRYVLQRQPV